jgi:hypothetical protein
LPPLLLLLDKDLEQGDDEIVADAVVTEVPIVAGGEMRGEDFVPAAAAVFSLFPALDMESVPRKTGIRIRRSF